MTIAFQWRVNNAAVDGATAFEWPSALPRGEGDSVDLPQGGTMTLTNGVYVIDLEDGVDLGTIDLEDAPELAESSIGYWVKASHVSVPQGCFGFRARVSPPGIDAADDEILFPDLFSSSGFGATLAGNAVFHQLRGLKTESWITRGSLITLLSDDAGGGSFGGSPAVGDYSFYLELGVPTGLSYRSKVMRIRERAMEIAQGGILYVSQPVVATETVAFNISDYGLIRTAFFSLSAIPAADEDLEVNLILIRGGTTLSLGALAIDDSSYLTANRMQNHPVNFNNCNGWLQPGDRLEVQLTYTAGGAPAPMAGYTLGLMFQPFDSFALPRYNFLSF